MHAISSYRGNWPTDKQTNTATHPQTGPITLHCAAASAQCNEAVLRYGYVIWYGYVTFSFACIKGLGVFCSHGDGQSSLDRDRLNRGSGGTGTCRSSPGGSSHGAASDCTVASDPATSTGGNGSSRADRKPVGLLIRGFPVRSSNSSVRDGLYHEFKRYGKVTSVHVIGSGEDRHAVVTFKKSVFIHSVFLVDRGSEWVSE